MKFFFLVLSMMISFSKSSKLVMVRLNDSKNDACRDCIEFTSLLDAFEYSFESEENITLMLAESIYIVDSNTVSNFTKDKAEKILLFENKRKELNRSIIISGKNENFQMSPKIIILHSFSIILNSLELRIENINIQWMKGEIDTNFCFFCLRDQTNAFSNFLLKDVLFEINFNSDSCIVHKYETQSIILIQGFSYLLFFERATLVVEGLSNFKYFYKILGRTNVNDNLIKRRLIKLNQFTFQGFKAEEMILSYSENTDFILENSTINNFKGLEITAIEGNFFITQCVFLIANSIKITSFLKSRKLFMNLTYCNLSLIDSQFFEAPFTISENKYSEFVLLVAQYGNHHLLNINISRINLNEVM